ncbi:hypothetical protein MBM_04541 [Drepanopeziza brunnea f. sp. 'multigermtubi' MB_m1]|uniref:Helix-turn-helix domain-containing protein n=1 Tax=Marssonina brunnea f. sp. multigermtubi (strain MB_m1) TaxID=1072389 RepID=K1XW36_MARBU|nr:uncharacterized protein MBM_04541 [Drepanopeziza brunnea f. sp. 'multigermtubi' MB_m1]EKD16964.1 hypothetical protein MBM_04541 [Drepanopeziza brunnea f. sp. 'multigermtubi' MB_m1]
MYTNIDPFRAIDSIKTIIGRASKGIRKSDLTKMMEFVLLNNFFKCQDKIYQQRNGLAISVACASILANLYCGLYEKGRFKYRNNKIKFYGRFINDLLIVKDRLVTRIYEKALNRHMYIPFSSAHPFATKRAFVKAERVRYNTICTRPEEAKACKRKLYLNLLRRGYPQKMLNEWFSETLKVIERPIPKLILPFEYNPV